MTICSVERTCTLGADASQVWDFATKPEGFNYELRPVLRMTIPEGLKGRTIADVALRETVGRSWLLLFGVIPVGYDDLCVAEIGPGHRFLEQSKMALLKSWQHERVIVEGGAQGCEVTDRLNFELGLSIPGAAAVCERFVGALFSHRHRRLAKRYGT